MKTASVLVLLIFIVAFLAGAWVAFVHGAIFVGTIASIGAVMVLIELLRVVGAWDKPEPWNDDGE